MKKTLLAGLLCAGVAVNCFAGKVLILSTTVTGGSASVEAQVAAGMGFTVDVVTPAVWAAMHPVDFAGYQAIIFGDPSCGSEASLAAAEANTSTWGPQVNGNIIIIGTDPIVHPAGGLILVTNAISFATAQAGKTGLYCCLSCYYWYAAANTPVPVLNAFGTFVGTGVGACYNEAHIVASSPTMAGLNDFILSDWSCSVHDGFTTWPSPFIPIAIAQNSGSAYTAPDLTVGTPYILGTGVGLTPVTSEITLTPPVASNPTNSMHTVCAKVVQNSALVVGATVTFTVISGPNTGTTGQGVTDASGQTCFTYPGTGGVGVDTISASAVDSQSVPITAFVQTATKTWFDPCGSSALAAMFQSVTCGTNVVEISFNEYVSLPGATNVANYMLDHGLTVTNVSFLPGSQSYMNVQADGNFVYGTTYTLTIANVQDLCGRTLDPNPAIVTFNCVPQCPSVVCPSNIIAQCTGPGGTVVTFDVEPAPGCTNVTVFTYPPSGSLFPVGVTTVNSYALGGGSNTCSFTVTVTDVLPPVIQCPSNIVLSTSCSDPAVYFNVSATDNCCLASVICTPASGSQFAFGTTGVNCVATDCNGNSSSCSFMVTVNQVADAGTPTISLFPTNVVVCTTNGLCGPMPDVTTQVQAEDGSETVYISQSIPPGTVLCTNTNVTLTVSNACGQVTNVTAQVKVGPCTCAPLVSLPWPSEPVSIDVFEGNGVISQHSFSLKPFDSKLLAIAGGPTPGNYDFSDTNGQFYDVYLSDANGTPDSNGCCVSIVCNMTNTLTDYSSGNNIDAVELVFADGSTKGADYVGSVQLGHGLTDPNLLYTSGMSANALGLPNGKVTYLGNGLSRITLCYSTPSAPTLAATHVYYTGPFLYDTIDLYWSDPFVRPWQVRWTTNFNQWNILSNPINVTNIYTSHVTITNNPVALPHQFFQLHFGTN